MTPDNGYNVRPETRRIRAAIMQVFSEGGTPQTVRQVYYRLSVMSVVDKTESGYRKTAYHLRNMRLDDTVPYGWIADNARTWYKPRTYRGMASALSIFQQAYRQDLWARQPDYVEIWIEKDALAGVIRPITYRWDVPLYVARGYSSMSFLYEAAESIKSHGKTAYVYHFGDWDPSGVDAAYKIRDGLRDHGADIEFKRVAVTEEQVTPHNLPTRPTKKRDPRAAAWGDKPSVELDAMPAPLLRQLVEDVITRHIEADEWERLQQVERLEKQTLREVISNFGTGTTFAAGGEA